MIAVMEYVKYSYLTLVALVALLVTMTANRSARIKGTRTIYIVSALTFLVSVCEYIEVWCDTYGKSYRILFYKAAAVYTLYPLIALFLLYLTVDIKHKFLTAIPQIIGAVAALVDLTGTQIIYYYGTQHNFNAGPLHSLPFWTESFYIILMCVHSMKLLKDGKRAYGMIVVFMAGCSLLTILMVRKAGISNQAVPAVMALELFTYYFYLSAIQYREIQAALTTNRLELERNKNNLLMAQIRPHFINSNLAVIRSLCYEDAENAVEMIDHFSAYLRENIKQTDDMQLVPFEKEMESVDNYLYLEMQRFPGRINVKKHFETTHFRVPSLSLQTIVENAVRHGISMTGRTGTIEIATAVLNENIVITIQDDGKGFDVPSTDFDGTTHVGIKNVTDRFRSLLGGEVIVESAVGAGTKVSIRFPAQEKEERA